MGLMQGRVQGDCLVILDSFALPVQGTETRVNAGNEALEYMSQYIESSEKVRFCIFRSITSICDSNMIGWTTRERDWVVSFSPRIWVLALWYRRFHAIDQPKIPGSLRSGSGKSAGKHLLPMS